MKKKFLISSLIAITFTLASCGWVTNNIKQENKTISPTVDTTQNTELGKNNIDNTIKLVSDRSDFHLKQVVKDFEKETWIKVETNFVEHWLLDKIKTKNQWDIYISKDSSIILIAAQEWLLGNVDKTLLEKVPALNKGSNWFNMTYRDRSIMVRKWMPEKEVPKNYEDLVKPEYKGKICIRKFDHNYNVELFSYLYKQHWATWLKTYLEKLADNLGRKPVWNDRNQVKGIVVDKACDIALVNTYYMWLMLENPEQRAWWEGVDLYFPNQNPPKGDLNGAVALYSWVWIKKWDENNESVKKFIKYILSVPVQKALSEHNYEYPITTTSDSELVKTLGKKQNLKMEDIKETSITQEEIAKVRNNVLKIIKEVEIEKWI